MKYNGKGLKIAFMGTRGVPASYSGFETFVEEIGWRLAERGYEIYVYNRTTHIKVRMKEYRGMHIINLPTIPTKHLDTIVHTILSIIHSIFRNYDIIYICGVGNSILSIVPRVLGRKVILNVDGADWSRKKWNRFARAYLKISERMATSLADVVISDSIAVKNYYLENYNFDTVFIPYGGFIPKKEPGSYLEKFGLKKDEYILFVGRLVPENNAHLLIKAFKSIKDTEKKLVIVGDAPYVDEYKRYLRDISKDDERIVFTGYLFGEGYYELSSNCYIYVLASEVGGTHPVLVEQMSCGNCVLVNDINPANLEVMREGGIFFDGSRGESALSEKLIYLLKNPNIVTEKRVIAKKVVEENYNWDVITDAYERLFCKCM